MDFGQLLHIAKKNSETTKSSEGKFYSTKFSAPKKVTKEKRLSDNIKKFLEKKEHEEREKALLEREKLQNLLSMRDEKSKNKIKKMLKVTKSANKSVLDDARDLDNTAVTMEGPIQPDEDDYGYVSNEAAAFFQKYVDKVGKLSEEKCPASRPKSKSDLSGTKDRVKAAILKDQDEKFSGRSKSSSSSSSTNITSSLGSSSSERKSRHGKDVYDAETERQIEERRKQEEKQKQKSKRPAAPPPMDFQALLKLAEKKQFEPVEIVKVETKKEPERLLTKKEKEELEQRHKKLEEKEKRKNMPQKMEPNGRIPKLGAQLQPLQKGDQNLKTTKMGGSNTVKDTFKMPSIPPQKNTNLANRNSIKPSPSQTTTKTQSNSSKTSMQTSIMKKNNNSYSDKISIDSKLNNGNSSRESKSKEISKSSYNGSTREFPPKDLGKKALPVSKQSYNNIKPREFPPNDIPTRKFPPVDARGSKSNNKKPFKRRILDDDDDDYDSEMDDFIDDGEIDDPNEISSVIGKIFGYDRNKYRQFDEEDDRVMESSFAQQMHEETISKKIGLMEDLEDMRQEAEDKKRKLIMLKKKKYK